jgi:hypothetical protein
MFIPYGLHKSTSTMPFPLFSSSQSEPAIIQPHIDFLIFLPFLNSFQILQTLSYLLLPGLLFCLAHRLVYFAPAIIYLLIFLFTLKLPINFFSSMSALILAFHLDRAFGVCLRQAKNTALGYFLF